jgi:IS30 family transposase
MIEQRPVSADTRVELGHWERDLVIGKQSGPALLVLQERKTRFAIIKMIRNKTQSVVNAATLEALRGQKVLTCTNDNGLEFGDYRSLERDLNAEIYFCQPYSSWERGTVENTNGLIRQYFPKGIDFRQVSQKHIKRAEDLINNRPKKILGYRTPTEVHQNRNYKMVLSESTYLKRINRRINEEYNALMKMTY